MSLLCTEWDAAAATGVSLLHAEEDAAAAVSLLCTEWNAAAAGVSLLHAEGDAVAAKNLLRTEWNAAPATAEWEAAAAVSLLAPNGILPPLACTCCTPKGTPPLP